MGRRCVNVASGKGVGRAVIPVVARALNVDGVFIPRSFSFFIMVLGKFSVLVVGKAALKVIGGGHVGYAITELAICDLVDRWHLARPVHEVDFFVYVRPDRESRVGDGRIVFVLST